MKKVNNFQIAKVQPQVSICLIFCQYQPGVAYKYFTFKKACILKIVGVNIALTRKSF